MEMNFKRVGVDAGMIMICDKSYYDKFGYDFDGKLSYKKEVPNGRYNCFWLIPDTWNGDVEGEGILDVTSGEIIISDPCYCIQSKSCSNWDKFLDITSFGENPEEGTIIISSMGGDGIYSVNITLEKLNE